MKFPRWRLAIVASAMLAAVLGAPSPAQAVPANCPAADLCAYWNSNYNPNPSKFEHTNASWGPWAIEDDDSSWCNNGTSGRLARVWTGRNWTGAWQAFAKGACWPFDADYNDKGSSNDWPWSV